MLVGVKLQIRANSISLRVHSILFHRNKMGCPVTYVGKLSAK